MRILSSLKSNKSSERSMNWSPHRFFLQELGSGENMNFNSNHRSLPYSIREPLSREPIDAIRLRLADRPSRSSVHQQYITTFSPRQFVSSFRAGPCFNHDRVDEQESTVDTTSLSVSITEREEMINDRNLMNDLDALNDSVIIIEPNDSNDEDISNDSVVIIEPDDCNDSPPNGNPSQTIQTQSDQCQRCLFLKRIFHQQASQIQVYRRQILEQADLLSDYGRYFEESNEPVSNDNMHQQQHDIDTSS